MRRIGAVFGILLLATSLGGCWVQPGFDPGRSYWNSGEATLTAANVDQLALQWEAASVGPAVTYGNAVVVTDGLTVSALDVATGAVRWTTDLAPELVADARLDGPPVIAGGILHVPWSWFQHGGYLGLDPTTGAVTQPPGSGSETIAAAAVVDDQLVSATAFLNPTTFEVSAQISWTYTPLFLYPSSSGPRPGSGFAIVGDRVAWSFGTEATGFSPACPPALPGAPPGYCAPDWRTDLGAVPTAVAAVGDDQVVYTDGTGMVTVLDMTTGAVAWTGELASPSSRPTVAGSTIFVRASGQLAAFPAGGCGDAACTPSWTATADAGTAPPVAGGDVVYIASGGDVLAFPRDGCGAATCAPLATLSIDGTDVVPSIVDGGRLLGSTSDGRVVAFGLPA